MTEQWYPQRNDSDSLTATLKTFIHHLPFPVSRETIDTATKPFRKGTEWSMETVVTLLNSWGMESVRQPVSSDQTDSLNVPALSTVRENDEHHPIVLFRIGTDTVTYVHPCKGWVFEDKNTFRSRWTNDVISVTSFSGNGEVDFKQREKAYQDRINEQKGLEVAKWFSGVLTEEECHYIIRLSEDKFGRSKIGDPDTEHEARTSYSAYLVLDDDVVLNTIRQRIARAIGIPASHFEYFQCVSYDVGQEYRAHYDTFDPATESGQAAIADGGQREWTILLYLNDDFVGGQTYFPRLDVLATPEKGCAVMFRNLDASGRVVPESFHAGLPVSKGRKYALNLWIRQSATNQVL